MREIIVCGHDECGGVRVAFDGLLPNEPDSELAGWLHGLLPSVARARALDPDPRVQFRRAVEENVLDGIANLMTFPSIAASVAAGQMRLHAWVYGLHEATLRVYDAAQDRFIDADGTTP